MRFSALSSLAPDNRVKTPDVQPTVNWSGVSISLCRWTPFEMNERLNNQSSSILLPRWTRICYWDVGISAQLSLLSLLLLLYTNRWVYAERLITQLSGQECNWAMQFHSVGWILIEYTQQERHSVDGWTQSEHLDRYWWFILHITGDTHHSSHILLTFSMCNALLKQTSFFPLKCNYCYY